MTSLRLTGLASLLLFICMVHSTPLQDRSLKSKTDDLQVNRARRSINLFLRVAEAMHGVHHYQNEDEEQVVASIGQISTNGTRSRPRRWTRLRPRSAVLRTALP
ncbi:Protein of unknown function [Gryllus bimaculatus]|nr:Protein of unknown function [Gryllus bimaculatus]